MAAGYAGRGLLLVREGRPTYSRGMKEGKMPALQMSRVAYSEQKDQQVQRP